MDDLIRAWMTWEAGRPTWPGRGPLVAATPAGLDPAGIEALEQRLGTTLPPSYRRFLAVADGWTLTVDDEPEFPSMLSAAEVGWVRDTDPHLVFIWDLQWSDGSVTSAFHEDEASYLSYTNDDPVYTRDHHLRACLQIGRFDDFDGVVLLLNPFVRDLRGEWEVWEHGSHYPGARRFPSFGDWMVARLIADYDVPEITPDRWRAVLIDDTRSTRERVWAARDLLEHVADEGAALFLAAIATDARHPAEDRVHAIVALDPHPAVDVLDLLDDLTNDPSREVRSKAMEGLATFGDEERRERIVDRLDKIWQPHEWKGFEDVLWRSWERTGRRTVLEALLDLGDGRAAEVALALFAGPGARADGLYLRKVGRALRTRAEWEQLAELTKRQDTNVSDVGPDLEAAGHLDLAMDVYSTALSTRDGDNSVRAVTRLATMATPAAEELLVRYVGVSPGVAAVSLRRYDSPRARMAVRRAASLGAARMACVTFEEMRAPEAGDELWALWLADGLPHAIVSLGRRRDRRVLPVAREWLRSRDTQDRHRGVECLRDLGAPDTFDELQALLGDADVDVAVVAAHALVMIDPVRARTVLAALAPADPGFAGLVRRWLAAA